MIDRDAFIKLYKHTALLQGMGTIFAANANALYDALVKEGATLDQLRLVFNKLAREENRISFALVLKYLIPLREAQIESEKRENEKRDLAAMRAIETDKTVPKYVHDLINNGFTFTDDIRDRIKRGVDD